MVALGAEVTAIGATVLASEANVSGAYHEAVVVLQCRMVVVLVSRMLL